MTVVRLLSAAAAEGLEIRALEPTDGEEVRALFDRLSSDSRYLRFLTPVHSLSDAMLAKLAGVDHDGHEAVGAFVDGALVGAAHWFRAAGDHTSAELAVEVADAYQRRGLARLLLDALGERARAGGITRFTALAWSENQGVLALVRAGAWPAVVRRAGAEVEIELALPA